MQPPHQDRFYILLIIGLVILFYPDLVLARAASLIGDHLEQHFPWAHLLYESLRQGFLPFWTNTLHCGFPIAAEGQIGIFYLPNLILSLLLPFKWAYAYANVSHFLLSGISTYLYAREVKLKPSSALIASIIFLFGTAYGGAFYNITSLKTIAWFPLSLFLFERYLKNGQWRYLFVLAIAISQSLVAGYLQVAIFTLGILLLYFVLRFAFEPQLINAKRFFDLMFCIFLGLLLAAPQIYLTYELAIRSNRVELTEDYAYVGSMPPLAFLTLLFPVLQRTIRDNNLYGGILALYFMLAAFHSKEHRVQVIFKIWGVLGFFSLLLALGQWSPLYILLVKLSHFYSFRIPSKFIVYACFSMAILAGIGFDYLTEAMSRNDTEKLKKIQISFGILLGTGSFILIAANLTLRFGISYLKSIGQWILVHFFYGKSGHPHSIDIYYEKLDIYIKHLSNVFSITNPWIVWSFAMMSLSFLLVFCFGRSTSKKKFALITMTIFLIFDLYCYAFNDIRLDFDNYHNIQTHSPIIDTLKDVKLKGKLGKLYTYRKKTEILDIIPSKNMLYGIEEIGIYSPLVTKRYYEALSGFGNIDDSNQFFEPQPNWVFQRLPLLRFLGVTHILSSQNLQDANLLLIAIHQSQYLYEIANATTNAHFIQNFQISTWQQIKDQLLTPGFEPSQLLLLENFSEPIPITIPVPSKAEFKITPLERSDHESGWKISTNSPGFFIVTDTDYPGWQATLNNKEAPILSAFGLFRAVRIAKPGDYEIRLRYQAFIRRKV